MTCEKITEAEKIQIAADILYDELYAQGILIDYATCVNLARRLYEIWKKTCEDV